MAKDGKKILTRPGAGERAEAVETKLERLNNAYKRARRESYESESSSLREGGFNFKLEA